MEPLCSLPAKCGGTFTLFVFFFKENVFLQYLRFNEKFAALKVITAPRLLDIEVIRRFSSETHSHSGPLKSCTALAMPLQMSVAIPV